jgi:hypothetical protein
MTKKFGIIAFLALILLPAGVVAAGSQGMGLPCGISEETFITPSDRYVQAAPLTEEEIYWLTYMREEEKVARDAYLVLNEKWNLRIFTTIAASEQRHMDAIKTLLDTYAIPDPAADKEQGEFTNPALQKLFNDLIQQGSISRVEALNVGILIEETDIDDLNEGITSTRQNDIKTVYSNLLQGSLNHLDAFESILAK